MMSILSMYLYNSIYSWSRTKDTAWTLRASPYTGFMGQIPHLRGLWWRWNSAINVGQSDIQGEPAVPGGQSQPHEATVLKLQLVSIDLS